jgi:adenosylcobinamide-GDP ribazoletransferase
VLLSVQRQLVLFFVATQFLTRLPTPALREFQPLWLSQSARYFPLVGVLIGLSNVGIWWLFGHWLPATVSVGLMLAASLLTTGAFHEDGFADTCDALGGGTTTDRVLAIMKDSRIGAYGAIGIFIMLSLKWVTLVAIPAAELPLLVIGAHMFSRWCASGLIWALPYVRIDGDAKARPFAGRLRGGEWVLSGAIGILGIVPAFACVHLSGDFEARAVGCAVGAAASTAVIVAAYFRRRIGGYTGDCLGAVQQLTELAFLLGGLAVLNPARRFG